MISDKLREALGLTKREVPTHIYRMRILGYPPGWIEDIKQHSSGLDLIDNPDSSSSEDEKRESVKYDVERIISYPGFNVPLDPDFRDVRRALNLVPI